MVMKNLNSGRYGTNWSPSLMWGPPAILMMFFWRMGSREGSRVSWIFYKSTEYPSLIAVSQMFRNFGLLSLMTWRLFSFSMFLIHLLP